MSQPGSFSFCFFSFLFLMSLLKPRYSLHWEVIFSVPTDTLNCTLGRAIASGLCLSDAHCLGNDVRKEMRKPGRPPYVSRREEAKEGKDYRDVIQILSYKYSCVFLDVFYKTTEPCLWKRRQLDNVFDILMHFRPFLGAPQWGFLYLKG